MQNNKEFENLNSNSISKKATAFLARDNTQSPPIITFFKNGPVVQT